MILKEIHKSWGLEISISPEEFFQQDVDFWMTLIYGKKLIIFKKILFGKEDYLKFCMRFGKIWHRTEYEYSRESFEPVIVDRKIFYLSPFSNIISKKIGNLEMPWHADIPNRSFSPYPFRSLWITKNPNSKISGHTSWLNLELGIHHLDKDLLDLARRTTIVQQSWYDPGTDIKEFPLIKIHPITGDKSLRLNYFVKEEKESSEDAWITGVKINGELQKNCDLIKNYLNFLSNKKDLLYTHVWDTFDLVIYDNWTFVHKRSQILAEPEEERHFYRININHCLNEEWKQYSKTLV